MHVRHIAVGLSSGYSLFACPASIFSELQQPLDNYSKYSITVTMIMADGP